MNDASARRGETLALVDALKATACCLIVLHHLAFYGPMSDHADDLFPSLFAWLSDHARLAVQVFLVLGGYLAARSLTRSGLGAPDAPGDRAAWRAWQDAFRRVAERFLRLALPLWGALALAVVCNTLADHWMDHPSISAPPQLLQGVLHLLMLQDIAGHEALSAGIWYVAIDFQLFVMLMALTAVARGSRRAEEALFWMVLLLLAVSAFVFNRQAPWDAYGPYFWTSYGLGVLVGLGLRTPRMLLTVAVVLLAYAVDPRLRLLVALTTAVLLWFWLRGNGRVMPRVAPGLSLLSRISYSVFLVHFPIALVVNALWVTFLPTAPLVQMIGVVTAFKLSLLGGWIFHSQVEEPAARWVRARVVNARLGKAASR